MASGGPLGEGRGLNITLLAEGGEELYILCHKYPADSKGCKFVSVFWMKSEEVCNLTAYMPAKDVTSLQVALKMCLCVSIDKPNFGPCEVSVLFSMRYELTFRACGRLIYIYIYISRTVPWLCLSPRRPAFDPRISPCGILRQTN